MKELAAVLSETESGARVLAPSVGIWQPRVKAGGLLGRGDEAGSLSTLGARSRVLAPASGTVVSVTASGPVGFGEVLVSLGELEGGEMLSKGTAQTASIHGGEIAMTSPSSGRFYGRPSPDKPPFVATGEVVSEGQVLCLLEVMKTFNRISYGGDGLPARAEVVSILVEDGADVESGTPLFALKKVE